MRLFRLIVIWAALLAILLLVIFSMIGSVLGTVADKGVVAARIMFNSLPMVCFWFLIVGLLVTGFFCFKRLLRSPGLLGAHLGSLLILAGAMWGSAGGHAAAEKLLGTRKIRSASMIIDEGYASTVLRDRNQHEIGNLPFKIGLKDVWLEYYEGEKPWLLIDTSPAAGGHERRQRALDWAVGEKIEVPFIDARLEVLQYLPGARKVYAEDGASVLEVTDANGNRTTVPVRVGQEVVLKSPEATLRIVKVFSHLVMREGKAVDIPGSDANPALKLLLVGPDGKERTRWAYAHGFSAHSGGNDGVTLEYLPGVEADPNSKLPAMEVLLTREGGEPLQKWLVAEDLDSTVAMALTSLAGPAPADEADANSTHKGHRHDPGTYLVMLRQQGMIKDYKSWLVVLEEGNVIVEKVIEVNHPLHYGGYHFYQYSHGEDEHGQYTVLSVTSDSGLSLVYAGFVLICAGVFWLFWFQPALAYLTRRRGNDDGGNGDQA